MQALKHVTACNFCDSFELPILPVFFTRDHHISNHTMHTDYLPPIWMEIGVYLHQTEYRYGRIHRMSI